MTKEPANDSHTLIMQLKERLKREQDLRRDAERDAAQVRDRFQRERLKLQAITDIAATHEHEEPLRWASHIALATLTRQTCWCHCRAYYFPFEAQGRSQAFATTDGHASPLDHESTLLTPSALEWLDSNEPLTLYQDRLTQRPCGTTEPNWPESLPRRCLYTIGLDGEGFGGFELFGWQEDEDPDFSNELMQSLARELAHIYKSERDRHSMEQMAYQDPLTGLGNRAAFFRDLDNLATQQQRLALVYIDIDGFREINDECGHDIGDLYLCRIAMRLCDEPHRLSVSRLGSDEFMVLLSLEASPQPALELAEALLQRLRQPIVIEDHLIEPGISAGLAIYPDDANTVHTLFYAADLAIYRAHESGGNTLRRFDADIANSTKERKQLAQQVRQAVNSDEFETWFQPIIGADRRIVGAEALLRWTAPQAPGPAEFVPVLERQGLMRSVGYQTLARVMARAAQWRREGLHFEHISVNVSPAQLREPVFVDQVATLLRETGLPAYCLILEITESLFISAERPVLGRLANLRRMGVKLALDDFGTGYSSLGYLQWMPLDILKIDKSFVARLDGEPARRDITIVRAIIRIARACGLSVVAEGIETEVVARRLVSLGAHYLQGYHFSRPVAETAMRALLREHKPSGKQR